MSNMKCVKCNSDLEQIGDFYTCTNPHCTLCGDKDMWQELIRTRKALDEATKYIKHTQKVSPFWFNRLANKTLAEIKTALEQKD